MKLNETINEMGGFFATEREVFADRFLKNFYLHTYLQLNLKGPFDYLILKYQIRDRYLVN